MATSGRELFFSAYFATNLPANSGLMPVRSSCSMTATERSMRPAYTSSPAPDFLRASVKPEAMSPGIIAQTLMLNGFTSFWSAST